MAPKTASEIFRQIDKNGDGVISRDEYAQALVMMNVPKEISSIVTDSVFSKFDSNRDEVIDEKEFAKYFFCGDNVSLHERMDRASFEQNYTIYWGVYFCLVGMKLASSPATVVSEVFSGIHPDAMGPACHMTIVLGLSWLTSGLNVLMQRVLKFSPVASHGIVAVFWSLLTIYENAIGSIYGVQNFHAPPLVVTVLSISLGVYGLWSMASGQAKMKEN
jgi:hypothetical protein